MKTSPKGLRALELREGIRLKGYKDSKGLPTIGVGHLIQSGEPYAVGKYITQEECDSLFADDIEDFENAVNKAVKVPLSQNQFDALVSFAFNIGIKGFKNSTCVRRLNAKDYKSAANAMMSWVKPPEITGRRQTEKKQFLTPDPVPATTAANDGNPTPPQPSEIQDQFDPTSTLTADSAIPESPDTSGADFTEGDRPDVPVTQTTNITTGLIDKAGVVGDKFASFRGVMEKFGFSEDGWAMSLGTKLFAWAKMASGNIMLGLGFITGHWELILAGVVILAIAAWLWNRARERNLMAKSGVPVAVITEVANTK